MKLLELSEDYEGLKRQFKSLFLLFNSKEIECSYYQQRIAELEKQQYLHSQEEMDALRDTIEMLTNRIEELEN